MRLLVKIHNRHGSDLSLEGIILIILGYTQTSMLNGLMLNKFTDRTQIGVCMKRQIYANLLNVNFISCKVNVYTLPILKEQIVTCSLTSS